MRVAGMVNTIVLSQQASQNFEQGMSEQQNKRTNQKIMKRVMMEIGLLVVGLSFAGLHTLVCYRLFGLVATLVIVGVQIVIASGIVWIKIRAPD